MSYCSPIQIKTTQTPRRFYPFSGANTRSEHTCSDRVLRAVFPLRLKPRKKGNNHLQVPGRAKMAWWLSSNDMEPVTEKNYRNPLTTMNRYGRMIE
jgi:hypothetical protein